MELVYYKNRSGLIAVSCDFGDLIILPTGKVMENSEFWEEVGEDLRSQLTPPQEAALKRAIERIDTRPVGDIVRQYSRDKRTQDRLNGIEHEPVYRKLSEDVMVVVADFD